MFGSPTLEEQTLYPSAVGGWSLRRWETCQYRLARESALEIVDCPGILTHTHKPHLVGYDQHNNTVITDALALNITGRFSNTNMYLCKDMLLFYYNAIVS